MNTGKRTVIVAALLLAFCGSAAAQIGRPGPHGPRTYRKHRPHRVVQPYRTVGYNTAYRSMFLDVSEFGYTFGMGDYENAGRLAFCQSGLMMVTPQFGMGVGVGINLFVDANLYNVPLYGMFRYNLSDGNAGLYIDCKVGYALGDVSGFYLSPSAGLRFGSRAGAVLLGVGFEMQKFSESDGYYIMHHTVSGLSLRIGYEF